MTECDLCPLHEEIESIAVGYDTRLVQIVYGNEGALNSPHPWRVPWMGAGG